MSDAGVLYAEQMYDDAMLGPDFAEQKWFPHHSRAEQIRLLADKPEHDAQSSGMWTTALMDCLLDGREYDLVRATGRSEIEEIVE